MHIKLDKNVNDYSPHYIFPAYFTDLDASLIIFLICLEHRVGPFLSNDIYV